MILFCRMSIKHTDETAEWTICDANKNAKHMIESILFCDMKNSKVVRDEAKNRLPVPIEVAPPEEIETGEDPSQQGIWMDDRSLSRRPSPGVRADLLENHCLSCVL